jgi:hypothetical protein
VSKQVVSLASSAGARQGQSCSKDTRGLVIYVRQSISEMSMTGSSKLASKAWVSRPPTCS